MVTHRLAQQLRLWIYLALFIWGGLMIWFGDRHDGTGAVLAVTAVILLYLERCPECGRLVWKEGEGWLNWYLILPVRAWWIGPECREPKARRQE